MSRSKHSRFSRTSAGCQHGSSVVRSRASAYASANFAGQRVAWRRRVRVPAQGQPPTRALARRDHRAARGAEVQRRVSVSARAPMRLAQSLAHNSATSLETCPMQVFLGTTAKLPKPRAQVRFLSGALLSYGGRARRAGARLPRRRRAARFSSRGCSSS
jgi:hypothetical protein